MGRSPLPVRVPNSTLSSVFRCSTYHSRAVTDFYQVDFYGH
jgi:hypothetical protein